MAVCVLLWTLPTFRAFAADVGQERVGTMSYDIQMWITFGRKLFFRRNIRDSFFPFIKQA